VESFSRAKSEEEARAAIANAKRDIVGCGAPIQAQGQSCEYHQRLLTNVFDNEDTAARIIKSFALVCGSGISYEMLKTLMEEFSCPAN